MPDASVLDVEVQNHWHKNDERYVRRAERASVDATELRRTLRLSNRGRRGRPFVLPPSMLDAVRRLVVELRLSFRAAEGHLRRMLATLGMKAPDHTTIWRRLAALQAEPVVPPRRGVTLAVDATGFSTTLRGEWMRDLWHVHRGFVKAHVAVDVASLEVVAVVVTDDRVTDAAVFEAVVQQALDRGVVVTRVLADSAYDTRANFALLRSLGIEAGIMIKSGATARSLGGTSARPLAVRELRRLGEDGWKERYSTAFVGWSSSCSLPSRERSAGR